MCILALVFVSQCEKSPKFDLSLIPGIYSGGLSYNNKNSTGSWTEFRFIQTLGYKTTISRHKGSFRFVFDSDCSIQIPTIEVFTNGSYEHPSGIGIILPISSIKGEDYKLVNIGKNSSFFYHSQLLTEWNLPYIYNPQNLILMTASILWV